MRFIGHEMRTPLNSVFMGMQLSIDQIPEDTKEPVEVERRETLVETQSACGAALDILNELLLFDKLETGALVLHKQSVPVSELVEDSVKIFTAQAREKNVELSITNNDETMLMPTVKGKCEVPLALCDTDEVSVDKNKVVQVIRNVVSNAIKFTPASGKIQVNVKFEPLPLLPREPAAAHRVGLCCGRGRVAPIIDPACDQAVINIDQTPSCDGDLVSGVLIIEVRDSGAGISEENQRRLFKEVVQFNPELLQNGGGSGLGMCISKGIMDMHGGSISVHSPGEGRGSVFTLRLPMMRAHELSARPYTPRAVTTVLRKPTSVGPMSNKLSMHPLPSDLLDMSLEDGSDSVCTPKDRPSLSRSSVSTAINEHPLRFLVVDDSKMNRKMLCRLLKNKGHECTEAEDGVQALAMVTDAMTSQPDPVEIRVLSAKMTASRKEMCRSPRLEGIKATTYDAILMDFM